MIRKCITSPLRWKFLLNKKTTNKTGCRGGAPAKEEPPALPQARRESCGGTTQFSLQ